MMIVCNHMGASSHTTPRLRLTQNGKYLVVSLFLKFVRLFLDFYITGLGQGQQLIFHLGFLVLEECIIFALIV